MFFRTGNQALVYTDIPSLKAKRKEMLSPLLKKIHSSRTFLGHVPVDQDPQKMCVKD